MADDEQPPYSDDDKPPDQPKEKAFEPDWDANNPVPLILDMLIAGLREMIRHYNEIDRLREILAGWNCESAEKCRTEIDHDDVAFLISDKMWLQKRIREYRGMLMRHEFYRAEKRREREEKKKRDKGDDSGATTET